MSSAIVRRRLHLVAMLAAGLAFPGIAEAQSVRTSTKKPVATNRTNTNSSRSQSATANSGQAVKKASEEVVVAERSVEPVRVASRSVSTQRTASAPTRVGSTSGDRGAVEQAACKNCQSHGAVHSDHTIEMAHEEPVQDEYSTLHQPDAYRFRTDACDSCGPGHVVHPLGLLGSMLRFSQIRVEAGTFWGDGQNLPSLVTTRRPANDPATDGLNGRPDTISLFGGREVLDDSTQGVRGEIGLFFDPCRTRGFMIRMFDASSNSESYNSASTGEPVVMRPFFSTADNAQSTIAVQYPGSTSGSIAASITSDVYGGDVLFRKTIHQDHAGRFEFLAGYQMMRLEESLSLVSSSTALTNTPAPAGTVSILEDHFATSNRFHGAAFGLNTHLREGCWSLGAMAKLGLGNVDREVRIRGASQFTVPGNPPSTTTSTNGLLARNTNEGLYDTNTFVVSPEVAVTLGYRFTRGLEATVSYSFLTLPKAARVGDQLDPQLASNLGNPPTGAATPRFSLVESNYSLHSLSYGLQYRY
ncbi:MAG: BBP7 family outer membrane beta-barrel protein [Pirellula sp.]|nr:BBP7 family outer membrane beta-barrel protein [Pirellula sp.]